jgi:hypothetical protein
MAESFACEERNQRLPKPATPVKDYITAAMPGMTTRSQLDLNLKTMSSTA